MSARLLCKLNAKSANLVTGAGAAEIDWRDVAGSLAGCPHEWYLAITAKWTEDVASQRELYGLVSSVLLARILRKRLPHPQGATVASRLAGGLVVFQFHDGYRCHHCGGRGIIGTKAGVVDCGNCKGDGGGVYSDAFRGEWLKTEYTSKWRDLIEDMESELSVWESEGLQRLRRVRAE